MGATVSRAYQRIAAQQVYSGKIRRAMDEVGETPRMDPQPGDVTRLLSELRGGNRAAESELIELVYQPLRRLALRMLASENRDHSMQATALVHEVYLRLVQPASADLNDRTHFMAVAARVMRRILVDHARAHRAAKRGGNQVRVTLEESALIDPGRSEEVLAIDDCLTRLGELDSRQRDIVEMRFFAGLSEREIAQVLGTSERTVRREWSMARAWMHAELTRRA
jgi:RNA polymerase sigma-70 factor (ECF subfamily)